MAVDDPVWSYGESKLIKSSGPTVVNGDDIWSYGEDWIRHEYAAPPPTTPSPTTPGPTTVGPTTLPPELQRRGISCFGFSMRDKWR